MTTLFVTGNKNKLLEAKAIIPTIKSINIDLPEIQALDAKEVVEDKARRAYERVEQPVVVEDVSLVISSWNGFPGALIKWVIKSMGVNKFSELAMNEKVLVQCVIGFYDGTTFKSFTGEVEGIITSPRGENGFGFDSIVQIGEQTIAELSKEEKSSMSMRAQAFRQLKVFLEK